MMRALEVATRRELEDAHTDALAEFMVAEGRLAHARSVLERTGTDAAADAVRLAVRAVATLERANALASARKQLADPGLSASLRVFYEARLAEMTA